MEKQNKYSLWIVPKNEELGQIQQFVNELADRFNAPRFVPHLTLVANILINSEEEYQKASEQAAKLADSVRPFDVQFNGLSYADEEFRCLFLTAEQTDTIDGAYEAATTYFPQVADEHFRAMPHMSVLYGHYPSDKKEEVIREYADSPLLSIRFPVTSFDLFLTNSPIESWALDSSYKLED